MNTMTKTKKLTVCAILVALSALLALVADIVPIRLPFGGSVTPCSMLPIVIAGYMFGIKWGFGTAFTYAVVQLFISAKTLSAYFLPGDDQMVLWKALIMTFLDYILAYTVIGTAGLFSKADKKPSACLIKASLTGLSLRYICHIVSGAIFFGAWGEWFFAEEAGAFGAFVLEHVHGNLLGWLYSVCYNGLYMIPEIVVTTIIAGVLPLFLKKFVKVYR